MNTMLNLLPVDLENIIFEMKEQLEITDKYKLVITELEIQQTKLTVEYNDTDIYNELEIFSYITRKLIIMETKYNYEKNIFETIITPQHFVFNPRTLEPDDDESSEEEEESDDEY